MPPARRRSSTPAGTREEWEGDAAREVLDLLPLVDVFLPNEPEALALTGERTAQAALTALSRHCPGWVVLKRGPLGVLAAGPGGGPSSSRPLRCEAMDTTGAGDSLAAGLLAELAAGADMAEALRTGVRVASTVPSSAVLPTTGIPAGTRS